MREDKFYELMGEIDPEIIAAADRPVPLRQKRGFRIALIAAVLAVALLITPIAGAFALTVGYFALRDDVNDMGEVQDPVQDDALHAGKPGGLVGELFGGIDWDGVRQSLGADGNVDWKDFFAALQGKPSQTVGNSDHVFKAVKLPDGTMKITEFINNGNETIVEIPEKISGARVTVIGAGAFKGHLNVTHVSIPDTVTLIEDYAFYACNDLVSVDLSANVREIGNYAFSDCNYLISINLPYALRTLGDYAFTNTALTKVVIRPTLTEWGTTPFFCSGLQSVEISDGVTAIPAGAFCNTGKLQEITLPSSVTEIGELAFAECTSLSKITLNDGLLAIGSNAFDSTAISEIVIPATVTNMYDIDFSGCFRLERVIFKGNAPALKAYPNHDKSSPAYTVYHVLGADGFSELEWYGYSCELLQCITQPYVSESGLATIPFYRETVLGTTGTSYFSEDVIVISNQVQRKKYEKILSGVDHNYELEADYFENYSIVLIKVMHSGSEDIIGVAGLGHIDTSLYPVVIVDSPELVTEDIQYTYIAVEIAGTDRYYSDAEIFAYNLNPEHLGQGSAHHEALPAFTIPE